MDLDLILEPDLRPDEVRELGLLAEQQGFRALWVQNYARARDAFLTAVPLAMATSHLRVGVVVVSPYEMHPLKIANAIATLAEYASGRACIVVGAGGEWNGVMGIDYGKRLTTAREAQQIVIGALSGGPCNFEGELFHARGFAAPWYADPRPLVYGGASGEQLLHVAAAHTDGVMMSDMQPAMFPNHMPHLWHGLAQAGRSAGDFRISNFLAWHVKADPEESYRESRRELIIRGWLERPWLEPYLDPEAVALVEQHKDAFLKAFRERHGRVEGVPAGIVQTLVDELSLAGGPDSIDAHIDRLKRFDDAGFTEIALRIHDDPADSIRMLGTRVLPALR
jgi:5,10-methylenetetrahydromethanopterin reductase